MLTLTKFPWINDKTGIRSEHANWYIIDADDVNNDHREAIVSAVNNTYGEAIDPNGVKDLLKAANKVPELLARAIEVLNVHAEKAGNTSLLTPKLEVLHADITTAINKCKL